MSDRARREHVRRWLVALWVGVAAAVWLGMFDVLISRGATDYLFRATEHELGRGPAVTMPDLMSKAAHAAAFDSSLWALFVLAAGIFTIYWRPKQG